MILLRTSQSLSTRITGLTSSRSVAVANMIEQLVHKMPAKEHKWLIRIILKGGFPSSRPLI